MLRLRGNLSAALTIISARLAAEDTILNDVLDLPAVFKLGSLELMPETASYRSRLVRRYIGVTRKQSVVRVEFCDDTIRALVRNQTLATAEESCSFPMSRSKLTRILDSFGAKLNRRLQAEDL